MEMASAKAPLLSTQTLPATKGIPRSDAALRRDAPGWPENQVLSTILAQLHRADDLPLHGADNYLDLLRRR
jgi:hypothetical protein